jgi:hypothetical protein
MSVCKAEFSLRATTVLAAAVLFAGCSGSPKSFAPTVDPAAAGKACLEQYDADKNGKMAAAELDAIPSLKYNIAKMDADGDGALSADEIAARVKFWQEKDVWRRPIFCAILRNGAPLADAEVKLVPEKFLGGQMKEARGKTNAAGIVRLSDGAESDEESPGVAPGFYRVEITKAGENIPVQYNSMTTLGLDASVDNQTTITGARFELRY